LPKIAEIEKQKPLKHRGRQEQTSPLINADERGLGEIANIAEIEKNKNLETQRKGGSGGGADK
jgi:hypothetical protein